MTKTFLLLFSCCFLFPFDKAIAQKTTHADSVVNSVFNKSIVSAPGDAGVQLIKSEKYADAASFYSSQINKDVGNVQAYMNRGVAQWQMNEPSHACRDWSAVLALGDTATFKLLDGQCHGKMVIEGDTLKKEQYHRMFSVPRDSKTLSDNSAAFTFVEEMPEFPGGENALLAYLDKNIKRPANSTVTGIVIVNFIVSTKGTILFPYIKKGIGGGCDEEVLRVFRNMPKWKAGKQNGKPVLVRYNIPVKF